MPDNNHLPITVRLQQIEKAIESLATGLSYRWQTRAVLRQLYNCTDTEADDV